MNREAPLDLMAIHVATLFDCDADGRLLSIREPWGPPRAPPRFVLGRTREGNVWHCRHDLPEEAARELGALGRSEPRVDDLNRPPRTATAIRVALGAHGPIIREERGPAYLVPEGVRGSTDAVVVTKENCRVLEIGFPWMVRHLLADIEIGPVAAAVKEEQAVSLSFCARLSRRAAEAGVETLQGMRGKGYATSAVAAWAAAVRERGLLPLYSTSWENVASRRLARKLGMAWYGDDWWIE